MSEEQRKRLLVLIFKNKMCRVVAATEGKAGEQHSEDVRKSCGIEAERRINDL